MLIFLPLNPVITRVARAVGQAPSQVLLAWAIQRGTAVITTSTNPSHIEESLAVSVAPEEAMKQISEEVTTRVRLNAVVDLGVPGFIPRGR